MKNALRLLGIAMIGLGAVLAVLAGTAGPDAPRGELHTSMTVKERVLSGVYKSYGMKDCPVPLWLAKTVIRNDTDARIEDLRIRYKVGEYADWSPWQEYPAVDPTQTVVDLYHPILSSSCARLTAQAPADLQMEAEYVDGAGEKQTLSDSRRIVFLGRHEFFFGDMTAGERTAAFQDFANYAPLLAAWVTSNDDVVARLASIANKTTGGVGASTNDESTIKVMRAVWDVMRAIDITYQHPASITDKSLSYDIQLLQSLQFPRDTIQKRSGTCIDLAILYASMLHTVGVRPMLVMMDGHCFPMGALPSGGLVPLEATGVGGGGADSWTFEQAVKSASETWAKCQQSGRFMLADCPELWGAGVANPELEPLPADILERWGITSAGVERAIAALYGQVPEPAAPPGPGPAPPEPAPGPAPQPEVEPAASRIATGDWSGSVTGTAGESIYFEAEVTLRDDGVRIVTASEYEMYLADGYLHDVEESNTFAVNVDGVRVSGSCDKATLIVDGVKVPVTGLPFRMEARLSAGGTRLEGTVTSSLGLAISFWMESEE